MSDEVVKVDVSIAYDPVDGVELVNLFISVADEEQIDLYLDDEQAVYLIEMIEAGLDRLRARRRMNP